MDERQRKYRRDSYARLKHDPAFRVNKTYSNMQSRVRGQQKPTDLYEGLSIVSRDSFVAWSLDSNSGFWPVYATWRASGYGHTLAPSVDRIDATKGYTFDNIEWVSWHENWRRRRAWKKLNPKQVEDIRKRWCPHVGQGVSTDHSYAALAKDFNVSKAAIAYALGGG